MRQHERRPAASLGGFCRRRTLPEFADELRIDYRIEGQSVILFEDRPDWLDETKRMHNPFAKLRFVRTTGLWTLYWMRGRSQVARLHAGSAERRPSQGSSTSSTRMATAPSSVSDKPGVPVDRRLRGDRSEEIPSIRPGAAQQPEIPSSS